MARPMSLSGRPGLDGLDAVPHALFGDLDELTAGRVDVADEEGGVGVAVDPADERRDVDVEDVAVLQHPRVGDAVADHLVGRGAHALGEVVVVERRRIGVALDVQLVDVLVDLVGGDAGADELAGQPEDLGGHDAGAAHPGDDIGILDAGLVPVDRDAGFGVGRPRDVVGQRAHRRDDAGQHPTFGLLVAALVLAPAAAPAGVVGLRQRVGGVRQRVHATTIRAGAGRDASGAVGRRAAGQPAASSRTMTARSA